MSGFLKKIQKAAFIIIGLMGIYIFTSAFRIASEDGGLLIVTQICQSVKNNISKNIISTYFPAFNYAMGERTGEILNSDEIIADSVSNIFPIFTYISKLPEYDADLNSSLYYDIIIEKEARDENYIDDKTGELIGKEQTSIPNENVEELPADKTINEPVPIEKLNDFDYLISNYYIVDKTTTINSSELVASDLLSKDMTLKGGNEAPQILIYHTHSQEAFSDSAPGDTNTSIVGVGEKLAGILREKYGFNVIHHLGQYDVEARYYAYSNALPDIQAVLADNPSIEVVIDLHRDGVNENTRLVTDINGKQTAKIMFFNGLSKTTSTGVIDYLRNPYINDNLAMSLQMKLMSEQLYPGFARPIFLKGYRYNMHLSPKCMLIEVGAQTNTVEEAMNAMEPLADILFNVLK